jgi:type I restriction-modification system DNA methylase subunit
MITYMETKTKITKSTNMIHIKENMDIKANLISVFKNCLNILRDNEGLIGEKALRAMNSLLTLKLLEPHFGGSIDIDDCKYYLEGDLDNEEDYKLLLNNYARFSQLARQSDDHLITNMKLLWDQILSTHPITRTVFVKGKNFDIQNSSTFKKLIDKLNTINSVSDYDILGNAYEEVIKDIMTGKVLGQFFTQPLVKKLMVGLINPQIYPDGKIETCGDPTMGTGGFLITYLLHILEQAKIKGIKPDWEFIKSEGLFGKELEPDTYQLAVSNMLISSGHLFEGLEKGDSIREPITRKFDNILANPPFGIKGLKYDDFKSSMKGEYVPIKSDNAVSLFIQAIIHMLKVNGKCAVVLPDGQDLFSKSNKTLISIREYLVKTCDLKEVIYLPAGTFEYTSIKTCVFYFMKKIEGTSVLEVTIKVSKALKESRSYKFSETHQTTEVKFYDYSLEGVKTLLVEVPIEAIANNSYSLNFSEYMTNDTEDTQYGSGIVFKTLRDVLGEKTNNTITLNDNKQYNVIGLSSLGCSKVKKQILGREITMKRQQLCGQSQFAISKILNGSYGFINEETTDGIISSEFWLFNINTDIILKKYLYHVFEAQIYTQLKKI